MAKQISPSQAFSVGHQLQLQSRTLHMGDDDPGLRWRGFMTYPRSRKSALALAARSNSIANINIETAFGQSFCLCAPRATGQSPPTSAGAKPCSIAILK